MEIQMAGVLRGVMVGIGEFPSIYANHDSHKQAPHALLVLGVGG